jgi:hypothetical protein
MTAYGPSPHIKSAALFRQKLTRRRPYPLTLKRQRLGGAWPGREIHRKARSEVEFEFEFEFESLIGELVSLMAASQTGEASTRQLGDHTLWLLAPRS